MTGWISAGDLRVVSYNIHHGVGMDGKLDLQRIAEVIRKGKPDFVALQEVDQFVPRSGKVNQAEALAKLLGMKHVFRKAIDLQGGNYGQAVLSRHPIEDVIVHKLPGKGEPRIALEVQAQVKGKKLSFCSVHLEWSREEIRLQQVRALELHLLQRKHPVILFGDFNARPGTKPMKLLAAKWRVVPKSGNRLTYPADTPKIEIDYLVIRGMEGVKVTCQVGDERVASDHRPLFGKIKWP